MPKTTLREPSNLLKVSLPSFEDAIDSASATAEPTWMAA